MIYTTLQLCKDNDACEEGYKKLLKGVGMDYPKDKPISLLKVLETNDLDDALWALQEASIGDNKIFSMKFGVWCARQSYKYWESEYPNDNRIIECIEATARFIEGEVGQGELPAAWSAARSARSAARSAESAAWSARSAARSAQEQQFIEMLNTHKEGLE